MSVMNQVLNINLSLTYDLCGPLMPLDFDISYAMEKCQLNVTKLHKVLM